jgi:acetoacetyl-CoA synthetase
MTPWTWQPTADSIARTRMQRFHGVASRASGRTMTSSPDVHTWSVEEPGAFWSLVWDDFGVVGDRGDRAYVPTQLPDAVFFPDARLNIAENLLMPWRDSDEVAVVCTGEGEGAVAVREELTGRELCARVGSFSAALRRHGVVPGDRIGLILPVGADALVCTLGALAVGAVVSSVSPEFGAPSIVDRLGQLEPTVLVVAPRYHWNGKDFSRGDNVAEVLAALPSVRVVMVTSPDDAINAGAPTGTVVETLANALAHPQPPTFERLPFDHPAYVLFSSGTTGKPKCLLHRAGGVLLKHLVEVGLHADVQCGDRLMFYTTTSWMMWNWRSPASRWERRWCCTTGPPRIRARLHSSTLLALLEPRTSVWVHACSTTCDRRTARCVTISEMRPCGP